MTVGEMIQKLSKFDLDYEVMIHDGECPRTINIGPSIYFIKQRDEDDTADCDGKVNKPVVKIGFGSY